MLMVASGGCTAAHLLAQAPLHELTLVDPNRAQLDLAKFKIHLLNLSCQKRLEILGMRPWMLLREKHYAGLNAGAGHRLTLYLVI